MQGPADKLIFFILCSELDREQEIMIKCEGDVFPWAGGGQNTCCCISTHNSNNSNLFCFCCFSIF